MINSFLMYLVGALSSTIKQSRRATGFSTKAKRERPPTVFRKIQCVGLMSLGHLEVVLGQDHGTNTWVKNIIHECYQGLAKPLKLQRSILTFQDVVLQSLRSPALLSSTLAGFVKPVHLGEGEESFQASPFKQPNGPYSCMSSISVSIHRVLA